MAATNHPAKQAVHDWMARRQRERTPPPSPEEVRRQLGWHLLPNNRTK